MCFSVLRGRLEPCASVKRSLRQGNMSFRGGSDGSSSHFFHPDLLRLSHVIPCSWSLPLCSYMFIPVLCLLDAFLPTSPRIPHDSFHDRRRFRSSCTSTTFFFLACARTHRWLAFLSFLLGKMDG